MNTSIVDDLIMIGGVRFIIGGISAFIGTAGADEGIMKGRYRRSSELL